MLRRKNSYVLSLWMLPLFAFLTVYIGCYYIIQKGPKLADKVSDSTNAWISACFGESGAGACPPARLPPALLPALPGLPPACCLGSCFGLS